MSPVAQSVVCTRIHTNSVHRKNGLQTARYFCRSNKTDYRLIWCIRAPSTTSAALCLPMLFYLLILLYFLFFSLRTLTGFFLSPSSLRFRLLFLGTLERPPSLAYVHARICIFLVLAYAILAPAYMTNVLNSRPANGASSFILRNLPHSVPLAPSHADS